MSSTQLLLANIDSALNNGPAKPLNNFEECAQEAKAYPSHVFYCRVAPAASQYAGEVFCEIHCPAHLFASWPLTHNGIQYQAYEQVLCGKGRGWKLLRFRTTKAGAEQLEKLCSLTEDLRKFADHKAIMRSWSKSFARFVTVANKTF